MGCTASKLDNEDTVRRCKERRRLMKAAVYARHHLAAAHSEYCRSLRLTGAALTTFAAEEPLSISDHTPAVLLRSPSKTPRNHPPPPPSQPETPAFSHAHSHSPTVASSKLPHILSASSHQRRKKREAPAPAPPAVKLPHILSDSSFTSSPKPHHDFFTYKAKPASNYSNTPSQTSSVWNWENFYPPSPPDSEYFDQLKANKLDSEEEDEESHKASSHAGDSKKGFDFFEEDKASSYSSHSNYSRQSRNGNRRTAPPPPPRSHLNRWESEDEYVESERETEREEVQCSEWGDHDHCSTTSSSSGDGEAGGDEDFRSEVKSHAPVPPGKVNAIGVNSAAKFSEKFSTSDASSTASWGNNNDNNNTFRKGDGEMVADRRIVVRHKDLAEIVNALREYFDKAAAAGEQVSDMLEIGRAQLDRNFSKLKKTVYHSSGVLSNLSSSWTSKPPLAVKYRFEPASLEESGCPKSLCSTLDRLLAWEKKLYQDVKAREGVKIEHEKKLSTLQSQEVRGDDEAKLHKTKASISRLQSMILVTSQAVSTTSSAIIDLRDSEFVPQLVELCHGFMYMWRSMNQFHEIQNDIVQQVRGLVNRATKGESTSDLHRQATRDLESAVSSWHSSFCRMIKFERDFIRSLHGWFKLTLVPVNSEQTNSNKEPSEVFAFCDEWKLALDRVPDTVASEAVKSFINVVHSISLKQAEELKIKKRTETASKELEKKASSLRSIEKKYYNSYSMVGIGVPNTNPDDVHALDARDPLSEKKSELASCQRRVEDEMMKHARAVEVTRAMTLNNLQTGLPGVFQAMTSFSALITEALETVCTRSYAIK